MTTAQPANFETLPPETLVHILSNLDAKDRVAASRVCRSWHDLALSNCSGWMDLASEDFGPYRPELASLVADPYAHYRRRIAAHSLWKPVDHAQAFAPPGRRRPTISHLQAAVIQPVFFSPKTKVNLRGACVNEVSLDRHSINDQVLVAVGRSVAIVSLSSGRITGWLRGTTRKALSKRAHDSFNKKPKANEKPKPPPGHIRTVRAVKSLGNLALTGSHDHTAKVWSLGSQDPLFTLKGHTDFVMSVDACNALPLARVAPAMKKKSGSKRRAASGEGSAGAGAHDSSDSGEDIDSDIADCDSDSDDDENDSANSRNLGERSLSADLGTTSHHQDQELGLFRTESNLSRAQLLEIKDQRKEAGRLGLAVTGGYDKVVRVWNLAGEVKGKFAGHTGNVTCVQFGRPPIESDDPTNWAQVSRTFVSASDDKTVRLWDIETESEVLKLDGHVHQVQCVQNDANRIVSGSEDGCIRMFDTRSSQCVHSFSRSDDMATSFAWVRCLQYDSTKIVSGSGECITMYDMLTGRRMMTMLTRRSGTRDVETLAFDTKWLVGARHGESRIRAWDMLQMPRVGNGGGEGSCTIA